MKIIKNHTCSSDSISGLSLDSHHPNLIKKFCRKSGKWMKSYTAIKRICPL